MLINPTLHNVVKSYDSYYTMGTVNAFPPANLLSIGTVLKHKTTHDVKILDAYNDNLTYEQIADEVAKENADIIGLPVHNVTFYDCLETIRAIRRKCPHVTVCVGGPLTKMFPKEILEHSEIDYVFLGDSEYTFVDLINALEKKKKSAIDSIKGIMYREKKEIVTTGIPDRVQNLDELPFPDLTLIDYTKYYSALESGKPVGIIIGSRGCPYQCSFCSSANSGYRMRSIPSMLDEIKMYLDYGISEFMFYDDTFNITAQRVIDFSKEVLARRYKIKWGFRGRIDTVSEEMFQIAKEAGLILMMYGVEDATDEGLEYMKRKHNLQQVYDGTKLAKKYKIPITINFMLGLPQHKTKEDVMRIIKLAKRLQPDYCQFTVFLPMPGTVFYTIGIEKGTVDPNFWPNYIRNPKKEAYAALWNAQLTREDLTALMAKAHRSFYFDPRYLIHMMRNVTSIQDFYTKTRAGLNLFKIFFMSKISGSSSQVS